MSVDDLVDVLYQAAQIEHLLANQYLFAAFSLKKYPEEFGLGSSNPSATTEAVWAQIERNRRWEAMILFTARQEMEHLCMVQNLLAIVDRPSYLWRGNYPLPESSFPLGVPFNLVTFYEHTMETFRYYEKPESLDLPSPFDPSDPREIVQTLRAAFTGPAPFQTAFSSVQSLYECVKQSFDTLLNRRDIVGKNPNRIVNEHFGFNIELEPIVQSNYEKYIDDIVELIIEQGEGVGEVPPPLGSHFMAFQDILHEVQDVVKNGNEVQKQFALPVVLNPALSTDYHVGSVQVLTNEYTRQAVQLFNDLYQLQCRMLTGFFDNYDIDLTTGIHPPHVNAYFRTAFYPMMTMIMRPLGEMLCRLPAFDTYQPRSGLLPESTAGPTFEIEVAQGPGNGPAKRASVSPPDLPPNELREWFSNELNTLAQHAGDLAETFPTEWRGIIPLGGEPFDHRFLYMSHNLWRMGVNFSRYWTGEIVAPIPSENFQNLPGIN